MLGVWQAGYFQTFIGVALMHKFPKFFSGYNPVFFNILYVLG